MTRLLLLIRLWFGLLLIRFSQVLNQELSTARRLCGTNLMKEIVKLCGITDWNQFQFEGETPLAQLAPHATTKVGALDPDQLRRQETPFPGWGRVTDPASTSASQEEAINSLEIQSLPEYQYKKANLLLDKTREFSSSHDVYPHIHRSVKIQKKSTNKIKASSLFWGNHPQRKRRGFSDKCCLKGCTKEELAIACFPYIDF
ncbi:PREDICTED: insulin-like peptide INSL6 [Chinchilla lanigera]|uniref:Insulin-like peptide INSL6 n=1 Tax=Chinchilla lanigera TaxID=34839 RepID=A0A8C2V6J3_CHILA|nr:PREDICTED: insulin-like peptide INSL6 [Chinchilla lanigera]